MKAKCVIFLCVALLGTIAEGAEERDRPRAPRAEAISGSIVRVTWNNSGRSADSTSTGSRSVTVVRRDINERSLGPERVRGAVDPGTTSFDDDVSDAPSCGEANCGDPLLRLRYKVCYQTSSTDLSPACTAEVRVGEAPGAMTMEISTFGQTGGTPEARVGLRVYGIIGGDEISVGTCVSARVQTELLDGVQSSATTEHCEDDFRLAPLFVDWRSPFTFPRARPPLRPLMLTICGIRESDDSGRIPARAPPCVEHVFRAASERPSRAPTLRLAPASDAVVNANWDQPDDAGATVVWRRKLTADDSRPWLRAFGGPAPGRIVADTVPEPGGVYEYRACAVNSGGSTCSSSRLVRLPFPTPPAATGLRWRPSASRVGEVEIEWNSAPRARRQYVRLQPGRSQGLPPDRTRHTYSNLTPGTVYELQHRYRGEHNRMSLPATLRFVPPIPEPVVPSFRLFVFDHGTIQYSWLAQPDSLVPQTVTIERLVPQRGAYSPIAAPTSGAFEGTDLGLAGATAQTYRVCARNRFENRCSEPQSATTAAADPNAPRSEKVRTDGTTVTFSWTSSTSAAQGFALQGWDGQTWRTLVADLPPSAREYAFVASPGLVFVRACAVLAETGVNKACSAAASIR